MSNKYFHRIGIIILNYKNWKDTIECLESLQRVNYSNYLPIVVDNDSSDGSVERIKLWAEGKLKVIEYEKEIAERGGIKELEEELERYPSDKKIVLIKNNANLGYSAGNNVGIRYSIKKNADAVLLLNPDVRVEDSNTLREMVDIMFSKDDIFVIGPNVIDAEGKRQSPLREPNFFEECINPFVSVLKKRLRGNPIGYVEHVKYNEPYEVEKVAGCCLLIRTEFLKKIGLFDERVFLFCEEPILAAQVKKNNGKVVFMPGVSITHLHKKPQKVRMSEFYKSRMHYLKHYKKYNIFQLTVIALTHRLLSALMFRSKS